MTEEIRILPGTTVFRQVGGTAGIDEIQTWHDGTNGTLVCKAGTLFLQTNLGSVIIDTNGNIFANNLSGTNTGINTGDQLPGTGLTLNSGTFNIGTTGVSAGTYGNSTNIPQIVVNAEGQLTLASNIAITYGTGSVTNIVTGAGLTGGPITDTGTISMGTSGVSAGTYGAPLSIPQFVVDTLGRVTFATNETTLGSMAYQNPNSVNITGGTITGMPNPTAASDVATKNYVDSLEAALNLHEPVEAATTANLTATYTAGSTGADGGSGVGATLTNSGAQVAFATDGYNGTVGDRILVKDQTTQLQNGIYDITVVGDGSTNWVLTRSSDYDNHAIATDVDQGDFVIVDNGSIYAHTAFIETGTNPIVVGTSAISFTQFSGAQQPSTFTNDVTGSGAGTIALTIATNAVTTTKINNSAVTYAKIQNASAATLLGNSGTAVAAINEIPIGAGLTFSGGTLNTVGTGNGSVTSIATGTGLTGGPITTTGTVSVATNGITYGLMQQVAGSGVLLGGTAASTNITEITIGTGLTLTSGTLTAAGGGGSGTAITSTITQANTFSVGNVLSINSGGTYTLAKADNAADAEVAGIVTAATGTDFALTSQGYVTGLSGLSVGSTYFLSPTSAGALTSTEPTAIGQVSKPLLFADTTTSGYFYNMRSQVINNLQTETASTLLGNPTASSAAPSEITIGSGLVLGTNGTLSNIISGTLLSNGSNNAATITAAVIGSVNALGTAATNGTITPNFGTSNNFSFTMGSSGTTLLANPTNLVAGQSGNIVITQNSTTASTISFGTQWVSTNGTAGVVTTTLGSPNLLSYYAVDSTHIWYTLNKAGVA